MPLISQPASDYQIAQITLGAGNAATSRHAVAGCWLSDPSSSLRRCTGGLAAISARIASTWPSRPFGAPRGAAGLGGAGGADRIERVRLALPPPVLPVRPAGPPPPAHQPR